MTTKEKGNGYKQKKQVTPEVFKPNRERERDGEATDFANKKEEHKEEIDKKPTERVTNTCKGILDVNEDTEMPGTFAGGGCSRGEKAHFREQPGINHTAKC